MSILTRYFGLGAASNDAVGSTAETISTTTEFLGKVAEKVPDLLDTADGLADRLPDIFIDALQDSAPWLSAVADAVGEALPPVKALFSIIKYVSREPDPNALGLLAVSVAYQAALADAAKKLSLDDAMRARMRSGAKLPAHLPRDALGAPEKPEDFAGFRLPTALSHPLLLKADSALMKVVAAAGFPDDVARALLAGTHARFADKFRVSIANAEVKEKFDPLFRLMDLAGPELATYAFLRRHLDYQVWRFRNLSVLGGASAMSLNTPLAKIFTPMDCGVLPWREIRRVGHAASQKAARPSPFDESFGGRGPLLETVLSYIRDLHFRDAIVVQGVAGAGKSAFTLQLCEALRDLGLRPLRVRMRDLSLDPRISLMEDVAGALKLNCGDDDFDRAFGPSPNLADVNLLHVLDEAIPFDGVLLCPYVLILDGWDEISISASEGFRIRIEKTLDAIRRQILAGRSHPVRVVLTGRPSDDVNEAKFLLDDTPILTVRPFTGAQLRAFVDRLVPERKAMMTDGILPESTAERIDALLEQFDNDDGGERGDQNILSLPLLALLAVWLVLNDPHPPQDIAAERSSLYKRLVDLTTEYGGNVEPVAPGAARITGEELRDLLQRTAAAMTLRGAEHISYEDLVLRLEASGLADPETIVGRAVVENTISKLMLSFFFNTGQRDHGCEFSHKSFREYLFAEAVVAALKRNAKFLGGEAARAPYWRDFDEGDPRRALVEELGPLLAPQWLRPEVWRHLAWLFASEIGRAAAGDSVTPLADWEIIRDRLAELWDWWGEGVHLRPQPYREKGKSEVKFNPPYAQHIAEQIAPTDVPRGAFPEPVRLVALDAHLGDALFRLNCAIHFQINKATGWLNRSASSRSDLANALWDGAQRWEEAGRRYQTKIETDAGAWRAFAPASPDGVNFYFENYVARINAAGWRPDDRFPFRVNMSGVDLFGAPLQGLAFGQSIFDFACLSDCKFEASVFGLCSLDSVLCNGAKFSGCLLFDNKKCQNLGAAGDEFCEAIFIEEEEKLEIDASLLKKAIVLSREEPSKSGYQGFRRVVVEDSADSE